MSHPFKPAIDHLLMKVTLYKATGNLFRASLAEAAVALLVESALAEISDEELQQVKGGVTADDRKDYP